MIDEERLKALLADPSSIKLHCMICGEPMQAARARDSKRKTCSPECYKALKAFYKLQLWLRRCPSCLHPSSPRQRDEWREIALHLGLRKGRRVEGRPGKKREKALEAALGSVLDSLKGVEGFEAPQMSGEDSSEQRAARIAAVDTSVREAAKLLAVPPTT
jgi:hypothetical protein